MPDVVGRSIILTEVLVTVLLGAATGSSAANPALVGSRIVGFRPSNFGVTSVYTIKGIVLNVDGSITVTTQANPTGVDATINVIVATLVSQS